MKISGSQVFWLTVAYQLGNTILLAIGPAISSTKQDTWISMLLGGAMSLGITYVALKASLYRADQTLVEFSQTLFGKWFGKIIVVTYFILWYSVIGVILREAGEFTVIALFDVTPLWLIVLILMLLVVYITRQTGLEGIGRFSEIIGPFILIVLLCIMALSIPNMNWKNALPVYVDSGMAKIASGAIAPASFFGESVMMMMLIPFIKNPKKLLPCTMWAVGISVIVVCVATLAVIFVFGPNLAGIMARPFFDISRFIRIMDFIQNIDIFFILVWILSIFVKLSLYFFITCYGTAQFLNLRDWRSTIWPNAIVVFMIAIVQRNITSGPEVYLEKYWITYAFWLNMVALPLLFFGVATIRSRRK